MNASLYISDQSFVFNGVDTDIEVAQKIIDLNDLWKYLHGSEDLKRKNIFYIQPKNFLSTKITKTLQICDLLEGKGDKATFRDTVNLFIAILSKGTRLIQSSTNEELQEYLQLRDEDSDCALVVFNKLENFPKECKQILCNKCDWLEFQRAHIHDFPHDAQYFIEESKWLFPDVVINGDTYDKLNNVYADHARQIMKCMRYLNDDIRKELKEHNGDNISFMNKSKPYGMQASYEGNHKKKDVFNLILNYGQGQKQKIYCEPHLKYNTKDSNSSFSTLRVYFHMPAANDEKIFVGYICSHL